MSAGIGTLPLCAHCGRPVFPGDPLRAHGGMTYHFECTRPPQAPAQPNWGNLGPIGPAIAYTTGDAS